MELKIKDLISLPEVRTVVQLSDLVDPSLTEALKTGFLFTEDVFTNVTILLDQIISGQGGGIFLEGSYGSGKSHFLTIISLLLSQTAAWEHFLKKEKRLIEYYSQLKDKKFLPVAISLVSHAGHEPLEQILSIYLNQALGVESLAFIEHPLFYPAASRRDNFDRLSTALKKLKIDGLVILMDELSEFLRSKSDGRSFNEDIRFLQFLGEYSQKNPFWLVASLQERLEEIGAITEESFNKIKDRYKIRLLLSAEHIEELIKNRLIIKKEGAEEQINQLYSSFKKAFTHLAISKDAFFQLYPVHPHTLAFLDELRFLFSQRRGIVDFIHYQIKGDSSRKIAGLMDQPADSLLGPEYIFDHFLVRIRETTTTRMYYQTVFGYFSRELINIFPEAETRSVAQRLLKILLLKAFSPFKKGLAIKELGEMILCQITSLDSGVNYRFLADIMEKLYKDGAYISCEKGKHFLEDRYKIDLKEDIQGLIRQKSDYIRQGLLPDDERIFDYLANWMDDQTLPLAVLKKKDDTKRFVKWQFTGREGLVSVRRLDEISTEEFKELFEQYQQTEADFFLFIDKLANKDKETLYQKSLLLRQEIGENLPFIFWLPQYPADDQELKDGLVYYLLMDKYREDFSETGKRIYEYLSSLFHDRKMRLIETFRQAYFQGELLYFNSEGLKKVNEIGILSFDKLLPRLISPCLNHLFPLHKEIAPLSDYFVRDTLLEVINSFFRPGEITFGPGIDKGLEIMIEGYLKPLKTIKQIPHGYRLNVVPATDKIISLFLEQLKGGKVSLTGLYQSFRKGNYGLSKNQFEMLALGMLFSGQARGFTAGREVSINRPDFTNLWELEEISEGELISPELREILVKCSLFPSGLKKGGFSSVMQQKAWESLIEAKKEWSLAEEGLLQLIRQLAGYKSLAHINLDRIEKDFLSQRALFQEIKISYSAKEGLERFLTSYRNTPFIDEACSRLAGFRQFAATGLDMYSNIFLYLNDQAMIIPKRAEYVHLLDLQEKVKRVLSDQERIFQNGYMDELIHLFNLFKEAYNLAYQGEHLRVKSSDIFSPYQALKESAAYKLLSRLARITMISVEDDLIKVDRYLAEVESMICRSLDLDQLRKRPVCNCGFKLGETLSVIPVKRIEETIERGINQYLEAMKEPHYREQIISYAVSLEDIGKRKEAEKLRKVIDLPLGRDDDPLKLEETFTDKVTNELNEALRGKVMIIERDINDLLENIIDRNFPRDRLLAIFTEWLNRGEGAGQDTYIKVKYKQQALPGHYISKMIFRVFPELIPLVRGMGEELFLHLIITCNWAMSHNIPLAKISTILAPAHSQDVEVLREKCQHVFGSIIQEKGQGFFQDLEAYEKFLVSSGKDQQLLDLLTEGAGEEELLEKLRAESIFVFSARGITSLLLKRLYSERDPGLLKKIQRMASEWKGKTLKSTETMDILGERINLKPYLGMLEKLTQLLLSLDWLDKARPFTLEATGWEKSFLDHGARFEILTEAVIKGLNASQMADSLPISSLKNELDNFIFSFQKGFSEYILQNYEELVLSAAQEEPYFGSQTKAQTKNQPITQTKPTPGPIFINGLRYHIFEKYQRKLKPSQTHFLLIDGLRWDLWLYCRDEVLQALKGNYRIVDQVPVWVFLPSTTATQIEPLVTGEPPSVSHLTEQEISSSMLMEEQRQAYARQSKGTDSGRFLEMLQEKDNLFTYTYQNIDHKIHTSTEDLLTLYEEIKLSLPAALRGYLEKLPEKSMVILFSDHGFIKKSGSAKKNPKDGSYTHGGNSPWEMIVPLVVLYRWL